MTARSWVGKNKVLRIGSNKSIWPLVNDEISRFSTISSQRLHMRLRPGDAAHVGSREGADILGKRPFSRICHSIFATYYTTPLPSCRSNSLQTGVRIFEIARDVRDVSENFHSLVNESGRSGADSLLLEGFNTEVVSSLRFRVILGQLWETSTEW